MKKKDTVSFSDFQKLDLRAGKVVKAEVVERSRNLIRMIVDLGNDYGKKKILAGIATFCSKQDLIGRKFIFVANLKSKQMMGEESCGMILVADEGERVILIPVPDEVRKGATVR